jgi:hypothetical protein
MFAGKKKTATLRATTKRETQVTPPTTTFAASPAPSPASSTPVRAARGDGARPSACAALVGECDTVITQFAHMPALRDVIQQRDELQRELRALQAAENFTGVVSVGKALKAVSAAVAQHPLSEEDYLTLADRHESLVRRVVATCAELSDAGEFDALEALAAKLEELKALDVSALPRFWANDPWQPSAPPATTTAQEGNEDDPVYVPAASGIPQSTAIAVAYTCVAISVTAEDEGANYPVYVPPDLVVKRPL